MSNEIINVGGRPTQFKPDFNEQAYKLSLLGATDGEIAEFFEVTETTINNWKIKHPKFFESIKDGKIKADAAVAHKLYDKALGAEWVEDFATKVKTIEYGADGRKIREFEEIAVQPVRKAAPPDTQAASLWLRNRQSGRWKDKIEQSESPQINTMNIYGIAPETVETMMRRFLEKQERSRIEAKE